MTPNKAIKRVSGGRAQIALLTAGLALAAFGSGPAAAATWPGAAPCDSSLQACIDAASSGEVIEIASNGPIDEDLVITDSLTLRPAAGFTPAFSEDRGISVNATDALTAVVQGLVFDDHGYVNGQQLGAGILDLSILDNEFNNFDCFDPAVSLFRTAGTGALHYTIRGNSFSTSVASNFCWAIFVHVPNGTPHDVGVIAANDFFSDGSGPGGIRVAVVDSTLDLEVTGNDFDGGYDGAIIGLLQTGAPAQSEFLVANNLVRGNFSDTATPHAIDIRLDGGSAQARVINNTVVNNYWGLRLVASGSSTLSGVVANNIVASNMFSGLRIAGTGVGGVSNDFNLIFDNGSNNFTPGPNTRTVDPQFAAPGDYHLGPGSPAIDAGAIEFLPPGLTTDLDGQARVSGLRVDLGAYEVQDTGVVFADGFESGDRTRWSGSVAARFGL